MAVIVLASASGAPGVTTTALGLAMTWSRPVVLVDADPVGGSAILAGYCRGALIHNDATVNLVLAHRDGRLSAALPSMLMAIPGTQVSLLPGARSHGQAAGLSDVWGALASELRALEGTGQDVIVDAGRLGMMHSAAPLIAAADLGLLVVRSDLPSLAAARQWAEAWSVGVEDGSGASSGVCLVVGEGRPYSGRDVARTLHMPVLESVAWDPETAAVFSAGATSGRKIASSRLSRSLTTLASAIDHRIAESRQETGMRQEMGAR